jgi:hypothetical protein
LKRGYGYRAGLPILACRLQNLIGEHDLQRSARLADRETIMFQTLAAHTNPVIVRDAAIVAAIVAAIDAAMLRRRDEYSGQPMAWKMFCEASHVATIARLM